MRKRLIAAVVVALSTAVATLALLTGPGAPRASAATVCDGDVCVIVPDTLQTPLGVATITVSATDVVTVQFTPTSADTLVVGVPVSIPPGRPAFVRSSIDTAGGTVSIDTFQVPPGPPGRSAQPSLAIISIHPPSPCRVRTSGTTVVFTPITQDTSTGPRGV